MTFFLLNRKVASGLRFHREDARIEFAHIIHEGNHAMQSGADVGLDDFTSRNTMARSHC